VHTPRTWPEASRDLYQRLTPLERFVLWSKLRSGQRRAVRTLVRSRSLHQIWSTIRLINDLAALQDETGYM
jgi:hypothetical protein